MTDSLADRIEAKKRRTAMLPVPVGDSGAAAQEVAVLRAALDVHLAEARATAASGVVDEVQDATSDRMRKQLSQAQLRLSATVVHVELQSLDPDVWDQVLEELQPDEDGELDLGDVRAALLAASVTADDERLQDAAWWDRQLRSGKWSKGDLLQANRVLLSLNLDVATGDAGKG